MKLAFKQQKKMRSKAQRGGWWRARALRHGPGSGLELGHQYIKPRTPAFPSCAAKAVPGAQKTLANACTLAGT